MYEDISRAIPRSRSRILAGSVNPARDSVIEELLNFVFRHKRAAMLPEVADVLGIVLGGSFTPAGLRMIRKRRRTR